MRLHNNHKGLTLIELLVVTVLLALISLIVTGSLASIIRAKDAIEAQQKGYQVGRAVLKRMERELSSRVIAPLSISQGGSQGGTPGEGEPTQGNPGGGQYYFLGQKKRDGGNDRDRLVFITQVGAQGQSSGFENRGRVEIEYRLEEKKRMSSNDKDATFFLVREERPVGLKDKTAIADRTHREILADNLSSLGFRYYAEKRWRTEWAEPRPQLPDVVEVTLKFLNPDQSHTVFRTAYSLIIERRPETQ